MIKLFRSLAVIAICTVLLFFGYHFFYAKPLQKEIDTSKTTIVTQLVALGNLETARMTLQKNVEGKQGMEDLLPGRNRDNLIQNFLFEDSIQITAYAEITAGFDLSKISSGSVVVNKDKSISLILQAPKVLSATLTKDTKPFLRKRGLLSQGDLQLESDVRNKTLEIMTQEAIQQGLLIQAKNNVQAALTPLFQTIGYTLQGVSIETGSIQL